MDTIPAGSRLVLHLGVIVQPYRNYAAEWNQRSSKGSGRKLKKNRKKSGRKYLATDTGQVAEWLEQRYGIMETFWNVYGNRAAGALENGMLGAFENMLTGAPLGDPFGQGCSQIEEWFRQFIASKEAENVGIPKTPTLAAIKGVNHRLKHPYSSRNPRRPSFLDTGLYMASFKAWMSQGI